MKHQIGKANVVIPVFRTGLFLFISNLCLLSLQFHYITFHFISFCNLCVKELKQESFLYNRCNYSDPHFLIAITSDPFVSGSGVRSTTGLYPFLFCATGKSHRQAELDWYDQHGSIYISLPSWMSAQLLWHWTDVTELLSIFKSRQLCLPLAEFTASPRKEKFRSVLRLALFGGLTYNQPLPPSWLLPAIKLLVQVQITPATAKIHMGQNLGKENELQNYFYPGKGFRLNTIEK